MKTVLIIFFAFFLIGSLANSSEEKTKQKAERKVDRQSDKCSKATKNAAEDTRKIDIALEYNQEPNWLNVRLAKSHTIKAIAICEETIGAEETVKYHRDMMKKLILLKD